MSGWQTSCRTVYTSIAYALFHWSYKLCTTWELNVGVLRPILLYPSSLGGPQRELVLFLLSGPVLCWKMRGKASERRGREGTEGGSLSCVGRLTCASGDPASFSKVQRQTSFWLLPPSPALFMATVLKLLSVMTSAATSNSLAIHFSLFATLRTIRHCTKFALKICIVSSVWMEEYGVCDLVSVWIICPTVS